MTGHTQDAFHLYMVIQEYLKPDRMRGRTIGLNKEFILPFPYNIHLNISAHGKSFPAMNKIANSKKKKKLTSDVSQVIIVIHRLTLSI